MGTPVDFVMGSELIDKCYIPKNLMIKGESIYINENDIVKDGYSIPDRVKNKLKRVSQLGLKEIWLSGESPGEHNRWMHSVRTFNVGYVWLKVLNEDNRVPKHCLPWSIPERSNLLRLAGHALLLHDYGHLPFSHLLGEVLSSINWLPNSGRWGGLEVPVIQKRLKEDIMDHTWRVLASANIQITQTDVRLMIEELILGEYSLPWLQTIINSPLDADKIDYIRYDSDFLQSTNFPVHTRIQQGQVEKPQWLEEFLQDQEVNHAGLLCLHGRSARAAADLWRDRIFLYDRFYMSPELRVPERMAAEIIQQFIIRSTMSDDFWRYVQDQLDVTNDNEGSFPAQMSHKPEGADPIEVKYQVVQNTILDLLPKSDSRFLEFDILDKMHVMLKEWSAFNHEYIDFLKHCFDMLDNLKNKTITFW